MRLELREELRYSSGLWRARINAGGGIKVGMRCYMVDLVPYDTRYDPQYALAGANVVQMPFYDPMRLRTHALSERV